MNHSNTIISPSTGQPIGEFQPLSATDTRAAVANLQSAFREWSASTVEDRHLVLTRLAQSLDGAAESLARTMAGHLGKPVRTGRREIRLAAAACRWHAEHAEELLRDRPIGERPFRYSTPRPLGVSLGFVPEHSPILETSVFVAANLLAGNGLALAASGATQTVAKDLADLISQCGVPADLIAMLAVNPEIVPELIELPDVQLVWFSGDSEAGGEIGRHTAEQMKRSVLQLSSNDAAIVAADANLERAAQLCAQSCLDNAGQYPWSLQRIIVDHGVLPVFQNLLEAEFRRWQPGDPQLDDTRLGPLLGRARRDTIHQQVQACAAQGAAAVVGGELPDAFPEGSAYYPPTVVANIAHGHPLYRLPVRGPVAALISVVDLDGAVNIANDSAYGMGVSVFTQDVARAETLARKHLDSAIVAINTLPGPRIDLPIGGLRRGGLRRLHGAAGFENFIHLKSVVLEDPAAAPDDYGAPDASGMRHEADPPRTPKPVDDRHQDSAADRGDGVPVGS